MLPLHVYIVAGQSNALGIATGLPEDVPNRFETISIYQEGGALESNPDCCSKVLPVQMGMGHLSNMFGLEMGMALRLQRTGPAALIKCAFAGTALFDFWKAPHGGSPAGYGFTSLVKTVQNGLKAYRRTGYSPVVSGIAWMQGESDADKTPEIAENYLTELTRFFDTLKTALSLPDLNIAVGEIYPRSPLLPFKDRVIQAQRMFAERYGNTSFIETEDLPVNPEDAYHWYGKEEITLGVRLADALLRRG